MKICTKCNAQNTNEAKMCNQCGAQLPDQIYPDMPNQAQQIIVQKPKKTHGCLIAFIIVLVAVVALIAAISIIAVSVASDKNKDNSKATISNSSTSNSSVVESGGSEENQGNEDPGETIYNIGDTATLKDWEITVTDFQIVDRIDSEYGTIYYEPEESGNKYAQISVTVSNAGNENGTFLPIYSYGDDVYTRLLYGDSEFSSTWFGESFDIHGSNIPPMSSQDGSVVFSVPSAVYEGGEPITLVFSNRTDSVSFHLR